ncbi:MAG: HAD-IA family hydrolase [Bacteroidales bacterium]|nr:HAD-IA family hydrolase [Bacteroidales bacterium]MBR5780998.1 HAD-IA family hydrolase [Bacteroidales bacterium]
MRKLVIFDLDGTLLYTLEDLMNSVNYALDKFGYETKTLEEINSFVGNGVEHLMRCAAPDNVSEEDFRNCYACFKEHYSEHCCEMTRPYDGIIETLKILKNRGVKVGIVSNKFQEAAEDVCEHYFEGLYDAVMGESEICRRKPAPDGINMICEQFGVEKDEAIFFGDSEVDVKTADNAGVYCVSVLWGFRDREFLANNGAHLFIENPLDIADMID